MFGSSGGRGRNAHLASALVNVTQGRRPQTWSEAVRTQFSSLCFMAAPPSLRPRRYKTRGNLDRAVSDQLVPTRVRIALIPEPLRLKKRCVRKKRGEPPACGSPLFQTKSTCRWPPSGPQHIHNPCPRGCGNRARRLVPPSGHRPSPRRLQPSSKSQW